MASEFPSKITLEKAIPCAILTKLVNIGNQSICRLSTNSTQGSAGLIQSQHNGVDYYLLITCNHVLPFTARDDLFDVAIHFEGLPNLLGSQDKLQKQWVQFCLTSVKYDATVIELTQDFVKILGDNGATFLTPLNDNLRINQAIALVQYPGGVLHFSHGEIYDITNKINVYYWVDGDKGSSGSPVLTFEGYPFAVHTSQIGPTNAQDPGKRETRGGVLLKVILSCYFEDRIAFSGCVIAYMRDPKSFLDNYLFFAADRLTCQQMLVSQAQWIRILLGTTNHFTI